MHIVKIKLTLSCKCGDGHLTENLKLKIVTMRHIYITYRPP